MESRIEQLSTHVVNKIAAGEVIERPASVVKELVENALDAGATRVDVTVRKGGAELIRVADNGHGIARDDMPLAIASHATSKIRSDDDLFSVKTLGFRGEALASIASVSRFRLDSRTADSHAGHALEVAGGEVGEVEPCGCPIGTRVEVNDLFFNTPVRKKFLRTTQTEFGHITEAITRMALAYPGVHFVLRHQDRVSLDLAPVESWRERISAFFGEDLAEHLIWIEHQDEDLRLQGYVADPTLTRANARMQYFFLNHRHIRDRSLQHALGEAYRGLVMVGRYPIAFLQLEMPPRLVDVNVHPTKLEVRFQDGGRVYSQLLGTLRNKFLTTDLTKSVGVSGSSATSSVVADQEASRETIRAWANDMSRPAVPPQTQLPQTQPRQTGSLRWDAASAVPPPASASAVPPPASASAVPPPAAAGGDTAPDALRHVTHPGSSVPPFLPFGASEEARYAPPVPSITPPGSADASNPPETPQDRVPAIATRAQQVSGLQVHDRYLICEAEEGVIVIDQHALHERVLYEQLCDRIAQGPLERQQLLVPETVQLTSAEAAALLDAREMLQSLGLDIDDFGGATISVRAYPAMLVRFSADHLLRELAELLLTGKKQLHRDDVLDQLLHTMACKAAVKAGDPLTDGEVAELLSMRHLVHDAHHCPHGRPTTLLFRSTELDRYFGRT